MQQRSHLRVPTVLHWLGPVLLVLFLLLAQLAVPAAAAAQDAPDEPSVPVVVQPAGETATQGTSVQINVGKDTFIASNQPNTNFGGLSNLDVGWYASFGAVRPLLKFGLDSIPSNAHINGAQLFLYLDFSLPNNDSGMRLNYARATQSWSEGSATWNNAAGIGGSQSNLGTVGSNPGWASFDLTSQVQQWVNGQSNNGLMIIGDETQSSGRARIFRSRDYGGYTPYLLVNYECDTLAPATFMNTLPQYSPAVFTASWGGQDRAPSGCQPSGIRKRHVQYQINGGAWVDWKSTTQTSETFNNFAPNGAIVGFRTYADDNAGNVEQTPSGATTTTIIVSQAPPVTMAPLPTYTNAASFTVSWTPGSTPVGVAGYDLQYQANSGPWTDLLVNSTQTSYLFSNAQNEVTYGFRVRARDNLGNIGAWPNTAQAVTTVVLFPIARVTPFYPNIIQSTSPVTTSFTVNWTSSTPPGTFITSYVIYSRVRNFQGVVVQPWQVWQTINDGAITNAVYTIGLGDGLYDFEATATNNIGQSTPVTGQPESTMIVDLGDTFKTQNIMPYISGNE